MISLSVPSAQKTEYYSTEKINTSFTFPYSSGGKSTKKQAEGETHGGRKQESGK
jgi:hypothetical protein